jgi:8-oxo-dGTP pyrophosphatase MutT (NUDIX family)
LIEAVDIEKLSRALRPLSDEQGANAAVALLLKLENADLNALFVKRVENLADPWSGQMALPGGKRDVSDLNLKQTIMRETLEETNIDLSHGCRFSGVLTALRSRPRPGLLILPFVILIEHEPSIRLNESELEGFFWVPLNEIIRGKGSVEFSFGEAPAYTVGRMVIWGLTFRVLEDFIRILELARQERHSSLTH